MPEENTGQMKDRVQAKQDATSTTSKISLRRVDAFAKVAIWTAAIAWGSFILFIIFGIIDSSSTFLARVFDGICIPLFYIVILTNLVSLFSGTIGLVRTCIKRKEVSGILKAVIAIILSLALFGILLSGLQRV